MKKLFTWYGVIAVLSLVLSYVFYGSRGLYGMSLGLGSTAFNFIAFRAAMYVVGKTIEETKRPDAAGVFGILALFIKLPIWCICAMIAQRAGGAVLNCFLVGLGLVYFAAIGWAQAKNR